jgi:hypothetical protein
MLIRRHEAGEEGSVRSVSLSVSLFAGKAFSDVDSLRRPIILALRESLKRFNLLVK